MLGLNLAKPLIHRQTCPWSKSIAVCGLKPKSTNSESKNPLDYQNLHRGYFAVAPPSPMQSPVVPSFTPFCSIQTQLAFNANISCPLYNKGTKTPQINPLYKLFQKMCKQITNIFSKEVEMDRICRFPVFRASAQGGDRYPKHGADQSDRVLPQKRRRKDRTGKTGVRCPRSRSNPANQIAELPHKPEAGAFGCGHRNRKGKKQGTDLMESLFPAFSMPCL